MSNELVHEYSPPWAEHVQGRYSARTVDENGLPEEQVVQAVCTKCGATFTRKCASGMVRQHISAFAVAHSRKGMPCYVDPLAVKKP